MTYRILIKIVLFSLLLLTSLSVLAQRNITISGKVVDGDAKPLEYFNVTLLSARDSSLIKGGAFVDGYFELMYSGEDKFVLNISHIGYHPVFIPIDTKQTHVDIGTIEMREDAIALEEVVVTAKRPMLRRENGNFIVNVQGTSLSSAGGIMDLLMRTPGVVVDSNNEISILGKGSPIIFIDGREIKLKEELEVLQSEDVARIELVTNPSARYSATGQAVLKVWTKKGLKDNTALMVYNNTTVGRRFSNVTGVQLSQRSERFNNILSYTFSDQNSKGYSKSWEINTLPDYTINNTVNSSGHNEDIRHSLFVASDYKINENQIIGIQFSGGFMNFNGKDTKEQRIVKTNTEFPVERTIQQDNKYKTNLYTVDLTYKLNADTLNSLFVSAGYARRDNNSRSDIDEENITSQTSFGSNIMGRGKYDVYSLAADYHPHITRLFETTVGGKYSQIISDGNSTTKNIETQEIIQAQESNIDDKIGAGYVQLAKKVNKFGFNAGVRFENTNSKIVTQDANIHNSYSDFFPSASINYEPSEKFSSSVSYSRRISRPTFYQIDPTIIYFDSLSYMVGNPFIKPAYINSMELDMTFFNTVTLTLGYKMNKGLRVQSGTSDPVNPDIVRWTYFNLDRNTEASVGIMVAKTFKFYSGSFDGKIDFPYTKIPYLNKTIVNNTPAWYFAFRNEFYPVKNLTLLCNFNYSSGGNSNITYFHSHNNLSAGAIYKLKKPALQFSVMFNDILRSGNGNHWEDRLNTVVSGMKANADNTWVRFGIRYNFNTIRNAPRQQSATSDELNRL